MKNLILILVFGLFVQCSNAQSNEEVIQTLKSLDSNQRVLSSKIDKIERNQAEILKLLKQINAKAIQADKKQNADAKNTKNNEDKNKTYNIPIGDSFVLGNPDAKVTITEWMDFQ